MGDQPSRGAYLFNSSRTRKTRGRAVPAASFCSKSRFTTTPTTNRFARSCRLWMSMTETCLPSQSIRCFIRGRASRRP